MRVKIVSVGLEDYKTTTCLERINSSVINADKHVHLNLYLFFKRTFDIILSLFALVLYIPLFLIIAVAIKLDSEGPAFYYQARVGQNGKVIRIIKFRTMKKNAEDMIKKFSPSQKIEYDKNFKLANDPRVTKVGSFLRKTSLDELPQLLNVLVGTLSIVGPRPVVQKEVEKYKDKAGKFLSVKPGLTGYWQVHGRSSTTYQQRIQMELFYVDNRSFWLDFKILLKTVPTILSERGAY